MDPLFATARRHCANLWRLRIAASIRLQASQGPAQPHGNPRLAERRNLLIALCDLADNRCQKLAGVQS